MMIYFVNHTKREYVYAGEAEGENLRDIIVSAGWSFSNDNIIIVADVERYENSGYSDVDSESSSESSVSDSESEDESDLNTSEEIDRFMDNLRRRSSSATLTDSSSRDLFSLN